MTTQLWKKFMIGLGVSSLLLAGCNNNEGADDTDKPEENTEEQAEETPAEDQTSVLLEEASELEEAEDVPEEEKQAILDAYNEYIESFNAEDVERYMATLSETPVNFELEKEEEAVNNVFSKLDVRREASNVKIVNYSSKKADVYSDLEVVTSDPESDREATTTGKQLTIFQKTDDGWKVSMIKVKQNVEESAEE
ncbi:nuclear transport factor 2 family protein [Rossellomorea vietnamensis]|uniref:Nuclear transport factor 2 family protein n=1 Tax=Rossellomorea aquimaris TaxID=189382 RepID=A0A5D4TGQ4_9BACI|nr:nuclear transport factor 2 family protein [Rossellomorea aquimaris]TYS73971.1 nuclear transport factor 2 family protein [Rossellomorea aquimaris]